MADRLLLVVSPLQGHMTPMLQLATYLHTKGFSITVAHSEFNRPDASNHPHFVFLPMADKTNGFSTGMTQFLQTLNENCKPHFQEHLLPSSCAPAVQLRFLLSNSSLNSIKKVGFLHKEIVPELDPFRYKDLPFISLPIQETLKTINMITPKTPPSAFIWNTLEFLEQSSLTKIRDHYQVPVFTIGPLHKMIPTRSTSFLEEDTTCISWLDKQAPDSVIYVSIGSLATIDEKVSIEIAWGLANSNQAFLWVVRPGSVRGFEWIEFLPEGLKAELNQRGLIVKWAPQKDVLAHKAVGGFWSHCGWNSILESVSEGVPLLCQPFDVDQRLNARNLSYVWKMGVEIVVERGEIQDAIRKILVGKEGEEMKKRAIEIQENVKLAISDGGSSQNSLNDLVDYIMSM